jgi:serine protease
VAARLSARALARLQRSPDVEYVERDPVRAPQALWSDVSLGGEILTYGLQMVQADLVASAQAGNRTVCIIDSGYAQGHDDLKEAATGEVTFDADAGSGEWDRDSCGHGTHVAGTLAAISGNGAGVVGGDPGARLHIVKVFGDDDLAGGSCAWTYSSRLVEALNRCVQAGAQVVNLSLGGDAPSRTERLAFRQAYAAGVLPIAAAGNGGGHRRWFPAGYPSVVSVAAVGADETVTGFSRRNDDVELAAPGAGVLSTVPWLDEQRTAPGSGYERWSGTSMAAPHVSAVAALVWSCHPSRTAAEIRAALTSTARDLGEPGRDDAYGFGLVQARPGRARWT